MTSFYDRLPYYARQSDFSNLLRILCDRAIEPEIEAAQSLISDRETLYDPYSDLSDAALDYLGQFFGLRGDSNHYLGVGLNPQWSAAQKRRVILAISEYWRSRGTTAGVKLGLSLWLDWLDPKISLIYPYRGLRNWFTYQDSYDSRSFTTRFNRPWLGSGDYLPGAPYRPFWKVIEDLTLERVKQVIPQTRSYLGSSNVWVNLYPDAQVQNRLAKDLKVLERELWDARLTTVNICWIEFEAPILERDGNAHPDALDIWLIVAGKGFSYALRPYYEGSQLSFLFRPQPHPQTITNLELVVNGVKKGQYQPQVELETSPDLVYGVRVVPPYQNGTAAANQFLELQLLSQIKYDLSTDSAPPEQEVVYSLNATTIGDVLVPTSSYFPNRPFIASLESDRHLYHTGTLRVLKLPDAIEVVDESELGRSLLLGHTSYQETNYILLLRWRDAAHFIVVLQETEAGFEQILERSVEPGFIPLSGMISEQIVIGGAIATPEGEATVAAFIEVELPQLLQLDSLLEIKTVEAATGVIGWGNYQGEIFAQVELSRGSAEAWRPDADGFKQKSLGGLLRLSDLKIMAAYPLPSYVPTPMVEHQEKLFFFSRHELLYWDGIKVKAAPPLELLPPADDSHQFTSLFSGAGFLGVGFDNRPQIAYPAT